MSSSCPAQSTSRAKLPCSPSPPSLFLDAACAGRPRAPPRSPASAAAADLTSPVSLGGVLAAVVDEDDQRTVCSWDPLAVLPGFGPRPRRRCLVGSGVVCAKVSTMHHIGPARSVNAQHQVAHRRPFAQVWGWRPARRTARPQAMPAASGHVARRYESRQRLPQRCRPPVCLGRRPRQSRPRAMDMPMSKHHEALARAAGTVQHRQAGLGSTPLMIQRCPWCFENWLAGTNGSAGLRLAALGLAHDGVELMGSGDTARRDAAVFSSVRAVMVCRCCGRSCPSAATGHRACGYLLPALLHLSQYSKPSPRVSWCKTMPTRASRRARSRGRSWPGLARSRSWLRPSTPSVWLAASRLTALVKRF